MSPNSSPARFSLAPHALWQGIRSNARSDVLGGSLLLAATFAALILANSPAASWYESVRDFTFGIPELHLELSIGAWAADGLLAIFFFVVGLELKEEFVAGRLRDPRRAALPIAAAVGGVVVPALIFVLINAGSGADALRGWAIPTATDIAFAVAVIAVVGKFLPPALRVFLLTLAIIDDLIAITIIATFYTDSISFPWLILALLPLAGFAALVAKGVRAWWLLLPLAIAVWVCIHASGVHATVAGVLLGFVVPVTATERARVRTSSDDEGLPVYDGMAAHFADRWSVVATLFAVPVFAFFAAGVTVGGWDGLVSAFSDPITIGIVVGLVAGKPIGILVTTFLLSRFPALRLDETLRWPDLTGMAFLAGIGFTVSLLVGELAYGSSSVADEHVKIGVLVGSFVAAILGGVILARRNARGRREHESTAAKV
ncbi:Na+/H+ antiporter NhaA [Microbacterium maritypicum]|uniref:Na(+)/H(+) antiporter NhaA n=1 Tax=Microbacterium maritypicum TaxID=33918 RepID=A0A4Y4B4I2_MICMQ|nr:Na+/H+ antiporter NhaA [Microbacterium liquefaciens]GEC75286.1 Na(+)/H(+) antiporter NhaA [Microbacterium liquefaciens]GGV55176.1 Na(+)/H(+) antiporter NhaA [Microbacterium liquefaciens]